MNQISLRSIVDEAPIVAIVRRPKVDPVRCIEHLFQNGIRLIEITMDTMGRFMKNLYTMWTFKVCCSQCATFPLLGTLAEKVLRELPFPRGLFALLPPRFGHQALGLRLQSTWCQP